jgi:hypothetical protein
MALFSHSMTEAATRTEFKRTLTKAGVMLLDGGSWMIKNANPWVLPMGLVNIGHTKRR